MSDTSGSGGHQPGGTTLYLAFELSEAEWRLGFTIGLGQNPRQRTIKAGDLGALQAEIGQAKQRFGLPETTRVQSGYEAGRDGFWLHRYLTTKGIANLVVDSASIEVNRRAKRAKTDRLDVGKLLSMLIRYYSGEKKVWSVVHVPSAAAEDSRHLHRELTTLKADRTRHSNRIKGLLAGQGVRLAVGPTFSTSWRRSACGMGRLCPPGCGRGWRASTPAGSLWTSRSKTWRPNGGSCCAPPRSLR